MGRVPYHEFVGPLHRCGLKTCQLGRKAQVHRKPKDFPEPRLEVVEADVRRLKAGFRALADGLEVVEHVLRALAPIYNAGSSGSTGFAAEAKWRECVQLFDNYHKKYAPKAPGGGKTG